MIIFYYIWLVFFAALIPLTELKEPNFVSTYSMHADAEVLDLLETASTQKEVSFFLLFSVFLCLITIYVLLGT